MMTASFSTVRLKDVGRIVTGKTPSSQRPELFGGAYPFITPSEMEFGERRVKPVRFLSEAGAKAQSALMLPPGSVAFVCIASIGKACIVKEASFTNQQVNSIVVDKGRYDPEYIYYLLVFSRRRIQSYAGGAATPIINKSDFGEVEVSVPALPVQRRIASILSTYDDLIENNTRRIEILEEMARRLYEEWFVHFRFPGHENADFEEGDLGRVPKAWSQAQLKDICDIKSGYAFKSSSFHDDGDYHLVTIKNVQDGCFVPGCTNKIKEVPGNVPRHVFLKDSDILLSLTGNVGRVCLVHSGAFLLNQRVAKLVAKPDHLKPFVYCMLRDYRFRGRLEGLSSGVAQQNLSPVQAGQISVVLPPRELLESFCSIVESHLAMAVSLQNKNTNLRAQRDLLLPKLISGEIDVSEVPMPN